MKLNLSIEYRTSWGEEIVLCLGGKRYPMAYVAEGIWQVEVARFNPAKASGYTYEVVRDGVTVRTEWKKHVLALPEDTGGMTVRRILLSIHLHSPMLSSEERQLRLPHRRMQMW